MSFEQENKELCKLVNINEDACTFYHSAREEVESPRLKETMRNLEDLHKGVVINLQNYIRQNGGTPEAKETLTGQAAQFWGGLMANISNDVDETLVTHLEEAEDRCLHSIQDAMEEDDVTPATKAMLHNEMDALQKSHDYVKDLKDSMKAA